MRDGKIVQSGKYSELLESGTDFGILVAAHETYMDLVDVTTANQEHKPGSRQNSMNKRQLSEHDENGGDQNAPKSEKGTSKLIEDEQRETGNVSWHVYKLYATEAFGWWGVIAVVGISLLWQGALVASDYWLAHETSLDNSSGFEPKLFIEVYGIIAAISIFLVCCRAFLNAFLGLKTAQIFFSQILHSILHAPMSFFDTTPSGRILSRVRFFLFLL